MSEPQVVEIIIMLIIIGIAGAAWLAVLALMISVMKGPRDDQDYKSTGGRNYVE